MPSTPLGLTYPASTDHTRIWEHLQDLATTADTAIAAVSTAAIPRYAYKISDEAMPTNGATLHDDANLSIAVAANSKYILQGVVGWFVNDAAAASTPVFAMSAPVGYGGAWTINGGTQGNGTSVWTNNWQTFDGTSRQDNYLNTPTSNKIYTDVFSGFLTTAATAGDLKLRWAQYSTTTAGKLTLKAYSYLMLTQVA